MKMRLWKLAVVVVIACFLFVEICESRGRGGGSRGGSSRGRSSSGSRSRNSRSSGGSGSKAKTTKYTPITPKSRATPVIVSQAKVGSRSNTFKKVLVGYLAISYVRRLSYAPVYRRGYPMYGRYVNIPEERAVRVMSTETKMLDRDGMLCLDKNETQKQHSVTNRTVVEVNTTIRYGNEKPLEFNGIDRNFTLHEKEGIDFEIVSRTRYNTTLVPGKDCIVVEERMNGTVLRLYETNPDGASTVTLNAWLVLISALFWLKNEGQFYLQ